MSRVTRFAARDPGATARLAEFLAHLRTGGLRLGVQETEAALAALTHVEAARPRLARAALKAVCTGTRDEAQRFDALFDAYWLDMGRVQKKIVPGPPLARGKDGLHASRDAFGADMNSTGRATAPEGGEGETDSDGEGKLIATETRSLSRRDLRDLVRPDEIAAAEAVARRIGLALRDRRSRRRRAARRGDRLHFRKTIRRSLSTGGEPVRLYRRTRLGRARTLVALCDVSGSMGVYSQVFLAFLAGLMRGDPEADAYLFHTRLLRITEALREKDAMRAIGRMSLMTDGFGGGSKIGESLGLFSETYARRVVDGRSVVLILSDGCDTAPPPSVWDALWPGCASAAAASSGSIRSRAGRGMSRSRPGWPPPCRIWTSSGRRTRSPIWRRWNRS